MEGNIRGRGPSSCTQFEWCLCNWTVSGCFFSILKHGNTYSFVLTIHHAIDLKKKLKRFMHIILKCVNSLDYKYNDVPL